MILLVSTLIGVFNVGFGGGGGFFLIFYRKVRKGHAKTAKKFPLSLLPHTIKKYPLSLYDL